MMRQYAKNPVGKVVHRLECKKARPDWVVDWLDGCNAEHIRAMLGLYKDLIACKACRPDRD